jgi:hypothetical protein
MMRTKLRKIYYVPGLISAIIIPLVFWYLGNRELQKPIPNVMDLGLPAKYNPELPINEQNTLEGIRNWDYQKIYVKPNSAKANSKYYVSELKKLNARNEKETGIEFILNDENSYGDFISILNDFHITKQERYGVDLEKTGHLFALVDYKNPNRKGEECLLCNDVIVEFVQESDYYEGFKKFQYQLSELPKQAFYLIFSFLLFLQISVLSFLRKSLY